MIKRLLFVLVALAGPAFAQTTTVTGTAQDPTATPYANGTVSATIILNTGQGIPAGVPASGSISPQSTSSTGTFSVVVPSPFTWVFTICAPPPSIGPRGNVTPQQVCFNTGPIAISGGSQNITANINAVPPPAIGITAGGVGAGGAPVNSLQFNNAGTLGGSNLGYNGSQFVNLDDNTSIQLLSSDTRQRLGLSILNSSAEIIAWQDGVNVNPVNIQATARGVNGGALGLAVTANAAAGETSNKASIIGILVQRGGSSYSSPTVITDLNGIWITAMGGGVGASATNHAGLRISDQGAFGTTYTAAIKIDAQTAPGYAIKVDGGIVDLGPTFFQTNGTPNTSQQGFNFASSAGVTGLSCTNPSLNVTTCSISNPDAIVGTRVATITEGTPVEGDLVTYNSSGVKVNKTPGIPGRVVTNSGTLAGADLVSCTPGSAGDRGRTIIFTNTAAVTETLPNPASANCGNNFNVLLNWFGGAGSVGGTLKAAGGTVNGIAGGTGIPIPPNSYVIANSQDNVNWSVFFSRIIKCGTNLTEVPNADGTVTCNAGSTISGLTTGFIPRAGSATTIVNSLCDEAITTANTLTCTNSAGAAFTGSSVKIGASPPTLTGNGLGGIETTGQSGATSADMFAWNSTDHCPHGIYNNVDLGCVASSPRTACTNGELALSAGWGTTATVTAVVGIGNTCKWTLTSSGTGQAANPTVTDTFVAANVLPIGTMLCDMRMTGGTGTTTLIDQTTVSATVPVFTFGGTPVAASTYIVFRRCGP